MKILKLNIFFGLLLVFSFQASTVFACHEGGSMGFASEDPLASTTDYSSGKMFLQNMNTDMISSQGTAIDEAIKLATTYFNDENKIERILIIISDGEDHNNVSLKYVVANFIASSIAVPCEDIMSVFMFCKNIFPEE
jgi:hypothetical protein